MLIDLDLTPDVAFETDTIVVGSGAVGLAIAVELARAGRSVTVIEAGGASITAASQSYFNNAKNSGLFLKGLHLGRFRALGGTTNMWGGQLVEFDEIVFGARPWLGYAAWPVTRADIAPFYLSAYRLLGLKDLLECDAIWRALKIDPLRRLNDVSFDDFFSVWLPEPNFARLFRHEVMIDPKLRVVINAPVVALEADASGTTITGVTLRDKNGARHVCKGKRIILANGTIEMVRLLKLAHTDGRKPKWSENPWLGKGFLDHLDCQVATVTVLDKKRFHDLFDNIFLNQIKYVPKLRLSSFVQREQKLFEACAYFLFDSDLHEHIANAKILARALLWGNDATKASFKPSEFIAMARLFLPMIFRYLRFRRMYNPARSGIHLRITCEQQAVRSSALTLLDERDALGIPIVRLNWEVGGNEIATMASFAESLKSSFEAAGLALLSLDPKLIARDASIFDCLADSNHHMGMVRLGHSEDDGVVDDKLRVFGCANLYAVGAAVFPSTGFANPTLTAIALGLRLANQIIGAHGA